jgi:hypothetical protein
MVSGRCRDREVAAETSAPNLDNTSKTLANSCAQILADEVAGSLAIVRSNTVQGREISRSAMSFTDPLEAAVGGYLRRWCWTEIRGGGDGWVDRRRWWVGLARKKKPSFFIFLLAEKWDREATSAQTNGSRYQLAVNP